MLTLSNLIVALWLIPVSLLILLPLVIMVGLAIRKSCSPCNRNSDMEVPMSLAHQTT